MLFYKSSFFKFFICFLIIISILITFTYNAYSEVLSLGIAYKVFGLILLAMGIFSKVETDMGVSTFYEEYIKRHADSYKTLRDVAVYSIKNNIKMKVNRLSTEIANLYYELFTSALVSNYLIERDVSYSVLSKVDGIHLYGTNYKLVEKMTVGIYNNSLYEICFVADTFGLGTTSSLIVFKNGIALQNSIRPLNPLEHNLDSKFTRYAFQSPFGSSNIGIGGGSNHITGGNNASVKQKINVNFNEETIYIKWVNIVNGKTTESDVVVIGSQTFANYSIFDGDVNILPLIHHGEQVLNPEHVEEVAFPTGYIPGIENLIGKSVDELIKAIEDSSSRDLFENLKDLNPAQVKDIPVTNVNVGEDGLVKEIETTTAEGEGSIKGTLNKIWAWFLAIPALLTDIFVAPVDFDYSLDFSKWKAISISDKFPFSIPFDLLNSVKVFASQSKTPDLAIKLDTEYVKINHKLDLSSISFILGFFRLIVISSFIFFLILNTNKFIKW